MGCFFVSFCTCLLGFELLDAAALVDFEARPPGFGFFDI